jgi:hypothetical protein
MMQVTRKAKATPIPIKVEVGTPEMCCCWGAAEAEAGDRRKVGDAVEGGRELARAEGDEAIVRRGGAGGMLREEVREEAGAPPGGVVGRALTSVVGRAELLLGWKIEVKVDVDVDASRGFWATAALCLVTVE